MPRWGRKKEEEEGAVGTGELNAELDEDGYAIPPEDRYQTTLVEDDGWSSDSDEGPRRRKLKFKIKMKNEGAAAEDGDADNGEGGADAGVVPPAAAVLGPGGVALVKVAPQEPAPVLALPTPGGVDPKAGPRRKRVVPIARAPASEKAKKPRKQAKDRPKSDEGGTSTKSGTGRRRSHVDGVEGGGDEAGTLKLKCSICGRRIPLEDIDDHSRVCESSRSAEISQSEASSELASSSTQNGGGGDGLLISTGTAGGVKSANGHGSAVPSLIDLLSPGVVTTTSSAPRPDSGAAAQREREFDLQRRLDAATMELDALRAEKAAWRKEKRQMMERIRYLEKRNARSSDKSAARGDAPGIGVGSNGRRDVGVLPGGLTVTAMPSPSSLQLVPGGAALNYDPTAPLPPGAARGGAGGGGAGGGGAGLGGGGALPTGPPSLGLGDPGAGASSESEEDLVL